MGNYNEYRTNLSINMMKSPDYYAVEDNVKEKLITARISENGQYKAKDQNADGFLNVDIDVASGPNFTSINVPGLPKQLGANQDVPNYAANMANPTNISVLRSSTGVYAPYKDNDVLYGGTTYVICVDPLESIKGFYDDVYDHYVVFTPAQNYDGFYDDDNRKIDMNGDTVVPGDGKIYIGYVRYITMIYGARFHIKKYDQDFYAIIN